MSIELTEQQRLRLVINNQNEGVRRFESAAKSEEGEIESLKAMLTLPGKTNFEISQLIHEHFGVTLEPIAKMSPSYHINLPRILRNRLFTDEESQVVADWQRSVEARSGVEHPFAKISISNSRFDDIIAKIRKNRLDGMSYSRIGEELESDFGINYSNPAIVRDFVHANPDLFPDLLEYDKTNVHTAKKKILRDRNYERAKFLSLHNLESGGNQKQLNEEIEYVEYLRVDQGLSWGEINRQLGERFGKEVYRDPKQLRKRVRMFMELGYFSRLSSEFDDTLQKRQRAEIHRSTGMQIRKLPPDQESEIYKLWLAVKGAETLTHFSGRVAQKFEVSQFTIKRIIKRAVH